MTIMKDVLAPPRPWILAGVAAVVGWCGAVGFAVPSFAADYGIENYRVGPDVDDSNDYQAVPQRHARNTDRDAYDQRHADVYGDDIYEPPHRGHEPERYTYNNPQTHPPYRGSLKDGYGRDFGEERRWKHRRFAHRDHVCIPKRRIRRMLRRAGWRGFRNGRVRGPIGTVEARRRGTRELYELRVDRCTGEVISARFIDRPHRRWRRRGVDFRDYRDDVVIRW